MTGQNIESIQLKHQVVAVAYDMPTSRTWIGKALEIVLARFSHAKVKLATYSAEYENGTGPMPGE